MPAAKDGLHSMTAEPNPELEAAAAALAGMEESIILRLIDRAQFRLNALIYEEGRSGFERDPGSSLFLLRLRAQEEMDSLFGRYKAPEERPFHRKLPAPARGYVPGGPPLKIADYDLVNLSPRVVERYLELVPRICLPGYDGQYGSSVELDIFAVQTIARRIHYGAFHIAEAKYRAAPARYREMIEAEDREAILRELTRPEVEERVFARVREKAEKLQSGSDPRVRVLAPPVAVEDFYRSTVIPLTKEGEVLYLLARGRDEPRL